MTHLGRLIFGQRTALSTTLSGFPKGQRKTFMSSPVKYEEQKTMATVKENLVRTLGDESIKKKLPKFSIKSQKELPARKMRDSFDSAIVPLSKNLKLREKYTTSFGNMRAGRLMEDLDMMAVWCCVKHICGDVPLGQEPFPYAMVTVSVDDIELAWQKTEPTADVRLSGHVTWVGKSSLEVYLWMDQFINGEWNIILKALTVMAARLATNYSSAIVNPLEAETREEQELIQAGEARRMKRLKIKNESLLTTIPSAEELSLVHKLFTKTVDPKEGFLRGRILPAKSKWMHDATLSTLIFCHPEHRNLHNKIFGGFLIRQALELSWAMAITYGLKIPRLLHMSNVSFHNPVDVGSILKMYASVTFSEKTYVQIFVYAEAFTLLNTEGKSTTSFNFTYNMGTHVDEIYPSTYLDAMRYIDGRRHFLQVSNLPAQDKVIK